MRRLGNTVDGGTHTCYTLISTVHLMVSWDVQIIQYCWSEHILHDLSSLGYQHSQKVLAARVLRVTLTSITYVQ